MVKVFQCRNLVLRARLLLPGWVNFLEQEVEVEVVMMLAGVVEETVEVEVREAAEAADQEEGVQVLLRERARRRTSRTLGHNGNSILNSMFPSSQAGMVKTRRSSTMSSIWPPWLFSAR
jgi:hypothetical protein